MNQFFTTPYSYLILLIRHKPPKRLLVLMGVCLCFTFSKSATAQVIVETFESTEWSTVTVSTSLQSMSKVVTATGISQTITSYTTNASTATTTTITDAARNTGSQTWMYSKGSIAPTGGNSGHRKHSAVAMFGIGSSSGYIISPVIENGIASFSFWVASGGGNQTFIAAIKTNTTNDNIAQSAITLGTSGTVGIVTSSSITNVATAFPMSQYSLSYSGTEPAQLVLYNNSGSGMFIDDIVITSPGILPVNFSNVKAYQKGNGIQVEWTNRTEANMNRYEVEKSTNGISFSKVASIEPQNTNSIASYTWYDAIVNAGNNFYRIKGIGKDGEIKYSEILKMNLAKGNAGISIYPNPVKGSIINLQFLNMNEGKYSLQLFNPQGQMILNKIVAHGGGSGYQVVDIGETNQKGTFILKIIAKGKMITQDIVLRE